jgi:ribosomal protein S18 acetylase RimI-like enzyme
MHALMPLDIRPATAADVPALLVLMEPFNVGERIPWRPAAIEQALRELLDRPELGFVLVACERAQVLAYTVLTYNYDLEWAGLDAFVTELWVEPQARGRGLGEQLLQAAEQRALAAHAHALHLMVRPENEGARRLYARQGYEVVPRLVMTKPLARPG